MTSIKRPEITTDEYLEKTVHLCTNKKKNI